MFLQIYQKLFHVLYNINGVFKKILLYLTKFGKKVHIKNKIGYNGKRGY